MTAQWTSDVHGLESTVQDGSGRDRTYRVIHLAGGGYGIRSNKHIIRRRFASPDIAWSWVTYYTDRLCRLRQATHERKAAGRHRPPDRFRTRCYRAEGAAGIHHTASVTTVFPVSTDAAKWCVQVAEAAGLSPKRPVVRYKRMRGRMGYCTRNWITLHPDTTLGVLLHEYAHHLTWDHVAHGVEWAQTFLQLVQAASHCPPPGRVAGLDLATFAEQLATHFAQCYGRVWSPPKSEGVPSYQAACYDTTTR